MQGVRALSYVRFGTDAVLRETGAGAGLGFHTCDLSPAGCPPLEARAEKRLVSLTGTGKKIAEWRGAVLKKYVQGTGTKFEMGSGSGVLKPGSGFCCLCTDV